MPSTIETLEALPGEGETRTLTQRRVRARCDVCGAPAHYKLTFLLPNARSNPASSAYGRDDVSWCSDAHRFACPEHRREAERMEGHEFCASFGATKRFAHMFLTWRDVNAE